MKKFAMVLVVLASAACGIPVSEECTAAAALTEDDCVGGDTYGETYSEASTFGAGGTCWQNTSTADSCTQSCQAALDACEAAGGGEGEGEG